MRNILQYESSENETLLTPQISGGYGQETQ